MHPTAKFQHALPYVVLPVSPSLAALHTTRAQHDSHSHSCSKCGSYLLHGNATTRVVRLRPKTRALRRTCHACGSINQLPINPGNPASCTPTPLPRDSPTPISPSQGPPETVPPPTAQTKSRSKKKTGLQAMLSRSREKEKEEQLHKNDGQVGLAAFLTRL